MPEPVEAAVARVYREQWPTLLASLAHWTGDLDRAEEAAAEAVASAVEAWPHDGIRNDIERNHLGRRLANLGMLHSG